MPKVKVEKKLTESQKIKKVMKYAGLVEKKVNEDEGLRPIDSSLSIKEFTLTNGKRYKLAVKKNPYAGIGYCYVPDDKSMVVDGLMTLDTISQKPIPFRPHDDFIKYVF